MPSDSDLTIVVLYPELLGTYGDAGNALALAYRARARDVPVRIVEVSPEQRAPETADVYLIGGGEDAAQVVAWQALRRDLNLVRALEAGATCLAVCAGIQLLSSQFRDRDGSTLAGLGVLDVRCGWIRGHRAVGEVVADPVGIPTIPMLTGYENHQGSAVLGDAARPLGRLVRGSGNGDAGAEGAVQGNIVATYMHGPVLVRNPDLADNLLERVTGTLPAFHDEVVGRLRQERLEEALGHSRIRGLVPGVRRVRPDPRARSR